MFGCLLGLMSRMSAAVPQEDDDLSVVPLLEEYDPEQLFRSLMTIAERQYAARADVIGSLATPEEWRRRQHVVRDAVLDMIGGLPERTPLNARNAGTLDFEEYRIEKVIYESRPKFYVTANVYVPKDGTPPYPAILSPCGHSSNGKAYESYQRAYIAAAKAGYVVLAYDPVSQGERLQILDEEGRSRIGVGTAEHCHQGNQAYLIGLNLAQIRLWDGIRSLDYLETRSDVDPKRIGVMGNSGGGTLTTYLCAVDPRVRVGSPNCYVTTLRRRFTSRVTADPEQNFVGQIARGIDHSDMLSVMAPRPVQIGAAIRDFFPIEGAREAYKELQHVYAAFGAADAVEIAEVDEPHGFGVELRDAMIRWMNRWLQTPTPEYTEPPIEVVDEARLLCTETGQVLSSLGGRTVFELLRDAAMARLPARPTIHTAEEAKRYTEKIANAVAERLAWERPEGPLHARTLDTRERDGLRIERVVFRSEPEIVVPTLVVSPSDSDGRLPATIWIHEDGKSAAFDRIRDLAATGRRVIAIDPRGMGETRSSIRTRGDYYARYGVETDLTYTSFMIGRPLLGLRVRDVVRAVDYALSRSDVTPSGLSLDGTGMGGLLALHAAILDPRVAEVSVRRMLASYRSLVLNELYDYHVNIMIPGVIGHYDLADVVAGLAPRPVSLNDLLDEHRQSASDAAIRAEYAIARQLYAVLGAPTSLRITSTPWAG